MFGFCVSRPRQIAPNAWRVHWQVWCLTETMHGEKEVFAGSKHEAELAAVADADDALAELEARLNVELPDDPAPAPPPTRSYSPDSVKAATYKLAEVMP